MRFALYAAKENMVWSSLLRMWKEADEAPVFESAWTFDHLHMYPETFTLPKNEAAESIAEFEPRRSLRQSARRALSRLRAPEIVGASQIGPCLDGWMTLSALLQETKRIRGGCLVTGMIYRHPALLANMAASVDIISNGRLELGLGTGWSKSESAAYGLELGSWTERFDRFDEGLECIVNLLTAETTTYGGKYLELRDARCDPKPIQTPHPPILIGGAGDRRTIPMVARYATYWQPGFDYSLLPQKKRSLAAACREIGRDPSEITIAMLAEWDGRSLSRFTTWLEEVRDTGLDMMIISVKDNDPRLVAKLAAGLEPLYTPASGATSREFKASGVPR